MYVLHTALERLGLPMIMLGVLWLRRLAMVLEAIGCYEVKVVTTSLVLVVAGTTGLEAIISFRLIMHSLHEYFLAESLVSKQQVQHQSSIVYCP